MRKKLKCGQEKNGTESDKTEIAPVPAHAETHTMTYQGLGAKEGTHEEDNNAFDLQNIHNEYDEILDSSYYNLSSCQNEANTYEDVKPYAVVQT